MTNILVVKLRYIGDVLLATPVLSTLRQTFPEARMTMAVNRGTEDILKWNPDLDEVLVVGRSGPGAQLGMLRAIRRRKFDCVIDLTDADRSAIMTWFSGAAMRIGFNEEHRWRGRLYSHVVSAPPGHRMERDLAAIRPLGIEPKERSLVLRTDTADEKEAERVLAEMEVPASAGADRQLVLLHPGARYWFKAWPAERFADLADRLADMGCRVIIGGGPEDGTVAEAIRRQARSSLIVVTGRLSLLPFVALLKRCALFIGNDTGAMHMAAAVGTPIVALFGPSNPSEWGPLSEHADVLYKGLDCRPCFHPTCRRGEESCMRLISIDEVFASAQQWLRTKVHS